MPKKPWIPKTEKKGALPLLPTQTLKLAALEQEEMMHARLGVIYLFGNTKVDMNLFKLLVESSVSVTGTGLSTIGQGVKGGVMAGERLIKAGLNTTPPSSDAGLFRKIMKWLEDFAKKVIGDLDVKSIWNNTIVPVIKLFAKQIFQEAATFVKAGYDVAKGVYETIKAATQRYVVWSNQHIVDVRKGHPSIICQSLEKQMNRNIGKGLYATVKGAASIGISTLAGPASVIVNLVIAAAEVIAKIIFRKRELDQVAHFCSKANLYWHQRTQGNGIHHDANRFNSWYADTAIPCPSVASLTLNSGVCGNRMVYLRMFNRDNTIISKPQLLAGDKLLQALKKESTSYLSNCGYNFSSNDNVVAGLLKNASNPQIQMVEAIPATRARR